MQSTRAELRLATDSAARAAAKELARTERTGAARSVAKQIAAANPVAGKPLVLRNRDIDFGRSEADKQGRYRFHDKLQPFNAVRVKGLRTNQSSSGPVSLYFGRLVGQATFEPQTEAVASFINVDICLVLDRSTSMKYRPDEIDTGMPMSDPRICDPPYDDSRWAALDAAVRVFTSMLRRSGASEQVAMVTYSTDTHGRPWTKMCSPARTYDGVTVDVPLTDNLRAIDREVGIWSRSVWNGGTLIEGGVRAALDVVTGPGSRESADKMIIVMTDGNQTFGDVLSAADDCAAQGVQCHAVTFASEANQALMRQVAETAGGRQYHATTAQQLEDAFRQVAGEIVRLTE
jgi:hypothetical protein